MGKQARSEQRSRSTLSSGTGGRPGLFSLLEQTTVRLVQNEVKSTGFFVAPGLILTCAHSVIPGKPVNCLHGDVALIGEVHSHFLRDERFPKDKYPDLATIRVEYQRHPCVALANIADLSDDLFVYGYSDQSSGGDPVTLRFEWESNKPRRLKLKGGQIRPGMSGAPILNVRTGVVCGMVTLTRERDSALGGRGVSADIVFSYLPQLELLQQKFHSTNDEWACRLSQDQRSILYERSLQGERLGILNSLDTTVKIRRSDALARFGGSPLRDALAPWLAALGPGDPIGRSIGRLLEHYLPAKGTSSFGGRSKEIDKLTEWLSTSALTNRLLLSAPAARGKTLLLLRWLDQQSLDQPIIFLPLSVRFELTERNPIWTALAIQLRVLLETLGINPAATTEGRDARKVCGELFEQFNSYLVESGTSALLVVDGLDEVYPWDPLADILPLRPAAGLRIIATARWQMGLPDAASWCNRLGWSADSPSLTPGPLSPEGIREILDKRFAFTRGLEGQGRVVTEIDRLSSGEPLVVAYLVEEIQRRGFGPENVLEVAEALQTYASGFAGVFERWLVAQQPPWLSEPEAARRSDRTFRRLLEDILCVLACAKGPLRLREIEHLLRLSLRPDEILSVNDVRPLSRFILETEQPDQLQGETTNEIGYVLGHAKIGEYIIDAIFENGTAVSKVRRGFIQWGTEAMRLLESGRSPSEVAGQFPYLRRYFMRHLFADDLLVGRLASDPAGYGLIHMIGGVGWERFHSTVSKNGVGGINDLVDDLQLLNTQLRNALSEINLTPNFSRALVRIPLRQARLREATSNIPVQLLTAACTYDLMTIADVMGYLLGATDEIYVEGLLGLCQLLDRNLSYRALRRANQIQQPLLHASAVLCLLPVLDDTDRIEAAREAVLRFRSLAPRITPLSSLRLGLSFNADLSAALVLTELAQYLSFDQLPIVDVHILAVTPVRSFNVVSMSKEIVGSSVHLLRNIPGQFRRKYLDRVLTGARSVGNALHNLAPNSVAILAEISKEEWYDDKASLIAEAFDLLGNYQKSADFNPEEFGEALAWVIDATPTSLPRLLARGFAMWKQLIGSYNYLPFGVKAAAALLRKENFKVTGEIIGYYELHALRVQNGLDHEIGRAHV